MVYLELCYVHKNKINMERTKCVTTGCENYGNAKANGKCNKCFHNWQPPGPNYKDKPEFPPPLTKEQLQDHLAGKKVEGKPLMDPSIYGSERNQCGVGEHDDCTEFFDTPEILEKKVDVLVKLIKESETIVVYTGAGISTSAGISDFRGPDGAWTRKRKDLRPTIAHMALQELVKRGIIKCVISTNCDNLHRRSGIPAQNLCELHGNAYKDRCNKCGTEIFRPTSARTINIKMCHVKGCHGKMKRSTVPFGGEMPEDHMVRAKEVSKKTDLALVLGSSMRVKPACWLPEYCYCFGKNGKIVLCNLQVTDYEKKSYLSCFGKCDDVMVAVMKKLGVEIPKYDPKNDPTEQLVEKEMSVANSK